LSSWYHSFLPPKTKKLLLVKVEVIGLLYSGAVMANFTARIFIIYKTKPNVKGNFQNDVFRQSMSKCLTEKGMKVVMTSVD